MAAIDGLYIVKHESEKLASGKNENLLSLLLRRDNLEVMTQKLTRDAAVWLCPAGDVACVEFFYILSGSVDILSNEDTLELSKGDSFFAEGLADDVRISTKESAELLYISNQAMFDSLLSFQGDLNELLKRIDDKDNITLKHSQNVMMMTVKLMDVLGKRELSFDDIAAAALFHDVGKCYTPDEILKKKSTLENEEYNIIKRHASDSASILKPRFGDIVANVAGAHHERLDGSGYPNGLKADDIPYEARVIAVADVYDAMTSQREYNRIKTPKEVITELMRMPEKFDITVVEALGKIVSAETV